MENKKKMIASLNRKYNQLIIADSKHLNVISVFENVTGLKRELNLEKNKEKTIKNYDNLPTKWFSVLRKGERVGWIFGIENVSEIWN